MGNVSRMSGSAWHVDVLKSKDKRRDKRKCKFYDREKHQIRLMLNQKMQKKISNL